MVEIVELTADGREEVRSPSPRHSTALSGGMPGSLTSQCAPSHPS